MASIPFLNIPKRRQPLTGGFLDAGDKIVMNRSHLIGEAKDYALGLAKTFQPKGVEMIWAADSLEAPS